MPLGKRHLLKTTDLKPTLPMRLLTLLIAAFALITLAFTAIAPAQDKKGEPPAKKAAPTGAAVAPEEKKSLLEIGQLCNLVVGGRTLQNYELLDQDEHYLKFRGSVQISPQTEVVLFHRSSIEGIGLVGVR